LIDLGLLLLAGTVAGILAGLLGIGGGVVIVPIVTLLLESQGVDRALGIKVAIGTSLATIVVTAMASVYTHHRKGAVDWGLVRVMGPAVFVGSLGGAWLADIVPGEVLYLAFVVFLFAVSAQMALGRVSAHRGLPPRAGLAAVSFGVGGVSALMGIGGGAMHVPFLSFCGVAVKRAIATAAAVGLPLAASGTLGYVVGGLDESGLPAASLGYVNLPIFAAVVAASLVFAPLGAQLAHRLPDLVLRRGFALFLFLLASRMAYEAWADAATA
jgi:uncharacterized membrane protein YfcA